MTRVIGIDLIKWNRLLVTQMIQIHTSNKQGPGRMRVFFVCLLSLSILKWLGGYNNLNGVQRPLILEVISLFAMLLWIIRK